MNKSNNEDLLLYKLYKVQLEIQMKLSPISKTWRGDNVLDYTPLSHLCMVAKGRAILNINLLEKRHLSQEEQ